MNKRVFQILILLSLGALIFSACAPPPQAVTEQNSERPQPPATASEPITSPTQAAVAELEPTAVLQEQTEDTTESDTIDAEPTPITESEITVENTSETIGNYPIVDTDQNWCFSGTAAINCGTQFTGQDAQYNGLQPAYQDNGDGTITDLNTGLMWIADAGDKKSYDEAITELETYSFAGYDDWRLPTIKEIYSLALFSGIDASSADSSDVEGLWPYIDDDYFAFLYGDESGSPRVIDAQWMTSTIYDAGVFGGQECFFGFNFADGRIKCYQTSGRNATYFVQYVRGGDGYGTNNFVDNGDGTVTDQATTLTWMQSDNGETFDWNGALNYCETLSLASSTDWRLPNIKELHSIVDYSRSPDTTNSAAIDPIFTLTQIMNEGGEIDYGFYWSSTTLISYPSVVKDATYISFGRGLGYMEEFGGWIDVHGAGAQRSDPKEATGQTFETGWGPQGDAIREDNYVLCVTGGVAESSAGADPSTLTLSTVGNPPGQSGSGEVPAEGEGPDLAAAAATLGVSEEALRNALGGPPPDFDTAAATLGVSVEALQSALDNSR